MLVEQKSSLKIAIVDDERELSNVCLKSLLQLGYPLPSIFNDGTFLVRAMMTNEERIDIVLMDYSMPSKNGIESARLIKKYRKDTKIVIKTG